MIAALRNRLSWWLLDLGERLRYVERGCRYRHPDGRVCGYYERAGVHVPAYECGDEVAECNDPSAHHGFVR